MKLSKETELEIRQIYKAYWDAYLSGDFETFASFLDDDIVIYGTAVGEIFYTKEEALKFYTATAEEMTGKADFRNRDIHLEPVGNSIAIYEQSQLYILIDDIWTFYGSARITGIFENKGDAWKLVHQHGSFPDGRTEEGQQIASEKIKEENLQLREAVQRRTVELENKTRELEIEASLERVRTVAMSMRKREDMLEVCRMISEQLEILGVQEIRNVQTAIFYQDKGVYINYEYYRLHQESLITEVDYRSHPIQEKFAHTMINGEGSMVIEQLTGQEVRDWVEYQATTAQFVDPHLYHVSSLHYYWYSLGPIALGMSTYASMPEAGMVLFQRFRNVFDLAYRRYLDIEHAEAQAREAQIEASLERVRSRSMAMQGSEELQEVIQVVYDQFIKLHILIEHTGFIMDYKTREDMHIWLADKFLSPFQITIPYFDSPHWNSFVEAKEKGDDFFSNLLNFEEKNKFYTDLFKLIPGLPEESQQAIFSKPGLAISTVLLDNVGLYIENFSGKPYSDDENATLMRFGKVFQQTYTRFLDLQKAEAQTREAQIEASLERVRSVALGMRNAADLLDICEVLYAELEKLEFSGLRNTMINILDNQTETFLNYDFSPLVGKSITLVRYDAQAFIENQVKKLKASNDAFVEDIIEGPRLKELIALRISQGEADDPRLHSVDVLTYYFYSIGVGAIGISSFHSLTEEQRMLLRRFRNVFEFAYRRYMDIAQAEASAREARIEAAMEKVRSRTMAMQKSNELPEAANLLFQQVQTLGMPAWSAGYTLWDENKKAITLWMSSEGVIQPSFRAPLTEDPSFIHFLESYQNGETLHVEEVGGQALEEHYKYMRTLPGVGDILGKIIESGFALPTFQIFHAAYFSHGFLLFITYEPVPDAHDIFKRFAKVFEQTYTRFLDLQKAEAQAREAQIETGLEKVRSRTMAMQSCDELAETAAVLLHELVKLGIAPNRLYIAIIENDNTDVHFYLTSEEGGKDCSVYTARIEDNISVRRMYEGWTTHQSSITLYMEGEELVQYFKYLKDEVGVPFKNTNFPTRRVQKIAFFSQGYIGIASQEDQPEETLKLLERFAAVFNLTYTRFNDLKQAEKLAHQATLDLFRLKEEKARTELALTELKAAQAQLIQSEKMASLGELTAGIAHEIQNPLNFVNNFSDVNTELIQEMKEELQLGNNTEAIAIANDIADNEQKINHHGKRADAIVKGMLQHSRSSGGAKEPTDINALCDEYLRLAYHGLRAKDKSFNATMKTDFEETIGKIDIIPQDIGRVILNLITNAFYAVNEKQKALQTPYPLEGGPDYLPTVTVKTKHQLPLSGGRWSEGAKVTVSVSDNGPGIPTHMLDKIFQPFFTTKPTGQGTGLGLSLSYDIVKAHGGELKVETKEGEGSKFLIVLPI